MSGWTTEGGYIYVGRRYELEGTVSGLIFETGRPGRIENYADAPGEAPEAAREMGWRSSVGAPITVEGRLWGVLAVVSKSEQPLPRDTERATGRVRRALRDRDREQRGTRAARAARRRTGGAATGGHARRRGGDAAPGVRRRPTTRWHGCSTPPLSVLLRYDADGTATVLATSDDYLGPIGRTLARRR